MAKKIRYVVNRYGEKRVLFSVEQGKGGDLFVLLKAAEFTHDIQRGFRIKEQRYTIHPSPNSPNSNTIKHTLSGFQESEKHSSYQHTGAIKSQTGFVPLLIKVCNNLASNRFDFHEKGTLEVVSLGNFNPEKCSLCFGVFVGSSELDFPTSPLAREVVLQRRFGQFNLVLIWSFIPLPAYTYGNTMHCLTGVDLGAHVLSAGMNPPGCINFFQMGLSIGREIVAEKICKAVPHLAPVLHMTRSVPPTNQCEDLKQFRI